MLEETEFAPGSVSVTLSESVHDHAADVRDGIDHADGELAGDDVTIEFKEGLVFDIEAQNHAIDLDDNAGVGLE